MGKRERHIYGKTGLRGINQAISKKAKSLKAAVEFRQSDHEGEIVEMIGRAGEKFDAIVINPAAYTHTSVAIRDAISAVDTPVIEVHISNIYAREEFRQKSLISPVAKGVICGFGIDSYIMALEAAIAIAREK